MHGRVYKHGSLCSFVMLNTSPIIWTHAYLNNVKPDRQDRGTRYDHICTSIAAHSIILSLCWQIFRVPPRWLFVRVETESAVVGWGERSLEGQISRVQCSCS